MRLIQHLGALVIVGSLATIGTWVALAGDPARFSMPRTTFGLLRAIRSHQVSSPTVKESVEYGRPNACNLCHLDQTLARTAEKLEACCNWFAYSGPRSLRKSFNATSRSSCIS